MFYSSTENSRAKNLNGEALHEPYVSPTGNIRGRVPSNNGNGEHLTNGHALPHHLVRWDD
jgi:hypothetical protein